jgi:hypothetical protein
MEMAGGGRRLVGFDGLGVCRRGGLAAGFVFALVLRSRGRNSRGFGAGGGERRRGKGIRRGGVGRLYAFLSHFSVLVWAGPGLLSN